MARINTLRAAYKRLVNTAETARKALHDAANSAVGFFHGRRVSESRESIVITNQYIIYHLHDGKFYKINKFGPEWYKYNSFQRTESEEKFYNSKLYGSNIDSADNDIDKAIETFNLGSKNEVYPYDDYPIVDKMLLPPGEEAKRLKYIYNIEEALSNHFTFEAIDNSGANENIELNVSFFEGLLDDEPTMEREKRELILELRARIGALKAHERELGSTQQEERLEQCKDLIKSGKEALKSLQNPSAMGKALAEARDVVNGIFNFTRCQDGFF